MNALSVDHAPVLTRHGWLTRHYRSTATTSRSAPETCPMSSTHKTWAYGFQRGRTLILDADLCDHDAAVQRETDAQGVLF